MKRFEGKTVLVTGAGSGIGAACVQRLSAEGAAVMAVDLHQASLDRVVANVQDSAKVHTQVVDISDRDQVDAVFAETLAHFGTLDGLVNSAGVRGVGNVLDTDRDAWQRVLSINLDGTFHLCQCFARTLKAQSKPGAIVNLSSAAGIMAVPNRFSYVAAKFGVSGITRAMALELASLGIRVNAIAPGMIRTAMTEVMFGTAQSHAMIRAAHPLGRAGTAEEVAAAIAFLLSDDASFITGVVLPVDGGHTTGTPPVQPI